VGQVQPLIAELKIVLSGQVAQAPWKVIWFDKQESTQTPHELRVYPVEQMHWLFEIIWFSPQL
jgi:hypothetical protein